jgi:hypothetical protein
MYALDINKLINWLLPTAIRKAQQLAWLNALLEPARWLHTQFINWSNATRYDLRITGQVRSLEFHLNRIFDPSTQHIYITDAAAGTVVFMYLESENQPVFLPIFISGIQSDFIVHCPNNLTPFEIQLRGFLDKYKLPSKHYEIIYDIIVI